MTIQKQTSYSSTNAEPTVGLNVWKNKVSSPVSPQQWLSAYISDSNHFTHINSTICWTILVCRYYYPKVLKQGHQGAEEVK